MKRLLLLFLLTPFSLKSQPITGAFTTGTMNSTTTTQQTIVESIVSKDYNSGYSYSIAGTGIEINGTGNNRHTGTYFNLVIKLSIGFNK